MDLNLLRKLVRLMERGELAELDISDDKQGLKVHLRRFEEPGAVAPTVQVVGGGALSAAAPILAPGALPGSAGVPVTASAGPSPGTEEFTSPMVGTFYRASSADAAQFVEVGQSVTPDSVLCIVEAMKVMNEIKAELSGEIVEILVDNAEPIEFGQPLFLIKKS